MSLAHSTVSFEGAAPTRWLVCLHGILGSGANWRSFARQLVAQQKDWGVALVDLRMHGRSQGLAAPHTVQNAARDVIELLPSLPGPAHAVLGHSFGGKVALAWLELEPGALTRVLSLDSNPGPRPEGLGSEDTVRVVTVLRALAAMPFASREAFTQHFVRLGFTEAISQWLAMNLRRDDDGYRFGLDLAAITALLDSYFATDAWPVVERVARGELPGVRAHFVLGGRSSVYSPKERARLETLAAGSHERVRMQVLPAAGHWVHVDDPQGTLAAVSDALAAP